MLKILNNVFFKVLAIIGFSITMPHSGLFAQILRPEIVNLVSAIEKENIIKSEGIGFAGAKNEQWQRYLTLKEKATNEELLQLCKHPNGVIRCYSFLAATTRNNINLFPTLLQHLTDTALVSLYQGCTINSIMVGDFYILTVTNPFLDSVRYNLSYEEKGTIDSLLLFSSNIKLSAKSDMLKRLKPEVRYYYGIRKLVTDEQNKDAIVALSKYKMLQDTSLIADFLRSEKPGLPYYGLIAVRYFPEDCFLKYIKRIHAIEIKSGHSFDYNLIRVLYNAMVQYKNEDIRSIIEKTLTSTTGRTFQTHSQFIWLALELYPNPVLNDLKENIKLTDFQKAELQYWQQNVDD